MTTGREVAQGLKAQKLLRLFALLRLGLQMSPLTHMKLKNNKV
jgi:hypothetical protein